MAILATLAVPQSPRIDGRTDATLTSSVRSARSWLPAAERGSFDQAIRDLGVTGIARRRGGARRIVDGLTGREVIELARIWRGNISYPRSPGVGP